MKNICLNIQDCGYEKTISKEEIEDLNLSQPFATCPLCGYYTVTKPSNVPFELSLDIFKKIYKQIRKNE